MTVVEHEFEFDKEWYANKVFQGISNQSVTKTSNEAFDESEVFENVNEMSYVHLVFPIARVLLDRLLPFCRGSNLHRIEFRNPEAVISFTLGPRIKPGVSNQFPDVSVYKPSQITVNDLFDDKHRRVSVRGIPHQCVQKYPPHNKKHSLSRDITKLCKIGFHPNVVRFCGVVEENPGRVAALLTEYVPSCTLREVKTANENLKEAWKKQIEIAVNHIHSSGAIWGDVHPSNIIVDDKINFHLIDFGGGCTRGWADANLAGTEEGDRQGCVKLFKFIESLPEA